MHTRTVLSALLVSFALSAPVAFGSWGDMHERLAAHTAFMHERFTEAHERLDERTATLHERLAARTPWEEGGEEEEPAEEDGSGDKPQNDDEEVGNDTAEDGESGDEGADDDTNDEDGNEDGDDTDEQEESGDENVGSGEEGDGSSEGSADEGGGETGDGKTGGDEAEEGNAEDGADTGTGDGDNTEEGSDDPGGEEGESGGSDEEVGNERSQEGDEGGEDGEGDAGADDGQQEGGVGSVLLTEVLYDPDPSAGQGNDNDNEWIEVYNGTESAVNMMGWSIDDGANNGMDVISDTELLVPAGEHLIVTRKSSTDEYWTYGEGTVVVHLEVTLGNGGLRNDGESVILRDAEGNIVDAVSWGDATDTGYAYVDTTGLTAGGEQGKSIVRNGENWEIADTPTPGA